MDDKSQAREDRRRLKSLLTAAGYTAQRMGDVTFAVPFAGKFRSWDVRISLSNSWVSWTTFIMQLPAAGPSRTAFLERVLEINDIMSVAKFVKAGDALTLDLEYRYEHLDNEAFRNLTGLLYSLAEEYFPELFRLASGDSALNQLEEAFKRPSLTGGSE